VVLLVVVVVVVVYVEECWVVSLELLFLWVTRTTPVVVQKRSEVIMDSSSTMTTMKGVIVWFVA
jgi:hypothetical protein